MHSCIYQPIGHINNIIIKIEQLQHFGLAVLIYHLNLKVYWTYHTQIIEI